MQNVSRLGIHLSTNNHEFWSQLFSRSSLIGFIIETLGKDFIIETLGKEVPCTSLIHSNNFLDTV